MQPVGLLYWLCKISCRHCIEMIFAISCYFQSGGHHDVYLDMSDISVCTTDCRGRILADSGSVSSTTNQRDSSLRAFKCDDALLSSFNWIEALYCHPWVVKISMAKNAFNCIFIQSKSEKTNKSAKERILIFGTMNYLLLMHINIYTHMLISKFNFLVQSQGILWVYIRYNQLSIKDFVYPFNCFL